MAISSYSITGSLFLMFVLLALFVVVPILVGVYVYRDARRRGMNAILWTVLCVLIPAFVGLIVYLIVRSEHSAYVCGNCGKPVREQFVRCPYCGASLKELCKNCGQPLEFGWKLCPACGVEIAPEQEEAMQARHPKDRGLGGLLAVAVLVPVLICCLLLLLSIPATSESYTASATWIESMTVEDMQDLGTTVDVETWIQECDEETLELYEENGTSKTVYVLRAIEEGNENTTTQYLVYRNDGYRVVSAGTEEKGWWRSTRELVLEYTRSEEEDPGYDLLYYEITGDKEYTLSVYSDSESTAISIEDVDELLIRYSGLAIDISLGENAEQVTSVTCTFYAGDEAYQSEVTESADSDSLANTSLSFSYDTPVHDGITSFRLEFCDEEGNLLFEKVFNLEGETDEENEDLEETNAHDVGGGQTWIFWVNADDNGNLVLKQLQ